MSHYVYRNLQQLKLINYSWL